MSELRDVGRVLLGSWPTQVAAWGREGIAAFLAELQARGLDADGAIVALRRWEGQWPPSAGEVAGAARRDPGAPTFDEALILMRRSLKADDPVAWLRASQPLVAAFLERTGVDRFRVLPIDDPDWGERHRRDLRDAWGRHVEAVDRRQVAALTAASDGLRQLDPLASIGVTRPALSVSNDSERNPA